MGQWFLSRVCEPVTLLWARCGSGRLATWGTDSPLHAGHRLALRDTSVEEGEALEQEQSPSNTWMMAMCPVWHEHSSERQRAISEC